MHGFLLIDKPAGITSHDVVRRIRRRLKVRRVGHGGTLDPMATGLVPVAIGEATRLLEYLSDSDKGYHATMRMGETTDSQDAEGVIVETSDWSALGCSDVESALHAMSGDIEQIPPMYSALKKNGIPLYKLARKGIDVERQPRPVRIHSIALTACTLPEVSFDVICSKGTYVRTLAHDVGRSLGCGAHLTGLRRFRHGCYDLSSATELATFESADDDEISAMLIPLIDVLPELPLVPVLPEAIDRLLNGVPPTVSEVENGSALQDGMKVRLVAGSRLLAIATFAPGRQREQRGDFELAKVFVGKP